jgi:hypothetical protein
MYTYICVSIYTYIYMHALTRSFECMSILYGYAIRTYILDSNNTYNQREYFIKYKEINVEIIKH